MALTTIKLRKKDEKSVFLFFLMILFVLLRIFRNSMNYSSSQQGGYWNYIAVVFVFIGLFSIVKARNISKPFFVMLIYASLVWINDLLHLTTLSASNLYYWIVSPYFVFVLFAFYYTNSKKNKTIVWSVRIVFVLMFSLLLYSLLKYRTGGLDDLLTADVYYLLCFIPILFFYEEKMWVKVVSIILTASVLILSEKRAGLIAFFAFAIIQYFEKESVTINFKIKRIIAAFVAIAVILLLFIYISETIGSNVIFRMSVIIDSGGSGRSRIYKAILDSYFNDSSVLEMLLGHGRGTIASIPGVGHAAAHNDYLHVLYIYGIAPFFLLIWIYFWLLNQYKKMVHTNYNNRKLYIGALIIFLILSFFSTFCVTFGYVTCASAFLGIILSDWLDYYKGVNVYEIDNGHNT